jgi:REP element-mobilizing transposase RayT
MARPLRIEFPGALYHVTSRGNERRPIFFSDDDRIAFLDFLGKAAKRFGWSVTVWVLMTNHFHLVVETPRANLVAGMKWLLGTYTMRFNRRHRLSGHLFAGRYKSLLIDGRDPSYLRTVCDYVPLNPARAGLVKKEKLLGSYGWSSYPSYLRAPRHRESWMRCDRLLGEHGLRKESRRNRLEFGRRTEARRIENNTNEAEAIRRGWRYGAEDFLARLLDKLAKAPTEHHRAKERNETDTEKAERILRESLAALGWRRKDLRLRRKSDPKKVLVARQLRSQTSVSLRWIADRLEMGTWTHVSNLLAKSVKSED